VTATASLSQERPFAKCAGLSPAWMNRSRCDSASARALAAAPHLALGRHWPTVGGLAACSDHASKFTIPALTNAQVGSPQWR
jgi:hypothetical protein